MSPVWNQPSSVEHLGGRLGVVVVAAHDAGALDEDLAVSSAMRTSVPGSGQPTEPIQVGPEPGALTVVPDEVSVRP